MSGQTSLIILTSDHVTTFSEIFLVIIKKNGSTGRVKKCPLVIIEPISLKGTFFQKRIQNLLLKMFYWVVLAIYTIGIVAFIGAFIWLNLYGQFLFPIHWQWQNSKSLIPFNIQRIQYPINSFQLLNLLASSFLVTLFKKFPNRLSRFFRRSIADVWVLPWTLNNTRSIILTIKRCLLQDFSPTIGLTSWLSF